MIESFQVVNEKIIKLAECTKVPRLMIIAGSNGSGKSTLLTALKKRKGVKGEGRFLYISPSRSWYRQKVRPMYLMGPPVSWSEIIESDTVRGIEGLSTRGLARAQFYFLHIFYDRTGSNVFSLNSNSHDLLLFCCL